MNVFELIKAEESFEAKPYYLDGILHIGYGRNLEDNPLTQQELSVLLTKTKIVFIEVERKLIGSRELDKDGLSEAEAEYLLRNDVNRIVSEIQNFSFWLDLSKQRKAVLISMAYIMGINGLTNFKKMLAAIQKKNYADAAKEIKWSSDPTKTSKLYQRLPKRCDRLMFMMEYDKWPTF